MHRAKPAHSGWVGAVLGIAAAAVLLAAGTALAEPVTPNSLADAATRAVRAGIGPDADVVVVCGPVPALGELKGMDLEIRPRLVGERRTSGPLLVSLELWKDGQRVAERTISAQVQVQRPVAVACAALPRGATLQAEHTRLERRPVEVLGGGAYATPDQAAGMRLKRAIAPGEAILARDLEPVPVVRRGEKVVATLVTAGITITVTGTALDDGPLGQSITVKNERGGKRLRGVVVGPGAVRIEPDAARPGG